ncbi:MAG: sigma-54 dependent transcriptional regulator [Bacteroides sp.]|nr:sigma-54 dependent transcriptional regulator [Prevotella sp.]MCM1408447.1 sigma-54 dependent transcriptional regulator [Treponema brennaborense]MCM1469391.1 sigma-54 dependent transcriptional regulator [Bacteroides sp.]
MFQFAILITASQDVAACCRAAAANTVLLTCGSVAECIKLLKIHAVQLILFDVAALNGGQLDAFDVLLNDANSAHFIVLSRAESIFFALKAVQAESVDIIPFPCSASYLRSRIEAAAVKHFAKNIKHTDASEKQLPQEPFVSSGNENVLMLWSMAKNFARTDSSILLLGESGTGKTHMAQCIHEFSDRRKNAFLSVNCAAIPDSLAESELFGTNHGAFTGAVSRPGYFEQCSGGTLFLDEIGELSCAVQAKLLRIIENGTFLRVGSGVEQKCDVRLLFATNSDLPDLVRRSRFRVDLYYRISDFILRIPPLRERKEDIPLFIDFFLPRSKKITGEAVRKLLAHSWPGNLRELKSCIMRAAVLSKGEYIDEDAVVFTNAIEQPLLADDERNICRRCYRRDISGNI